MPSEHKNSINAKALEYFSRGNFKRRMKHLKEALADFDRAIELYPSFSEAYFKRGNVKMLLGDDDGAIKDYNRAIDINPNLAEAYNNRGLTKIKSGDSEGGNLDVLKAGMLGYFKAYDVNKEFCT